MVLSGTIWLLGAFFRAWSRARWCLLMALKAEKCGGGQSPEETFLLPLCQVAWRGGWWKQLLFIGYNAILSGSFSSQPYCQHHTQASAEFCNEITIEMTWRAFTLTNCVSLSWNKFELSYYGASDLINWLLGDTQMLQMGSFLRVKSCPYCSLREFCHRTLIRQQFGH